MCYILNLTIQRKATRILFLFALGGVTLSSNLKKISTENHLCIFADLQRSGITENNVKQRKEGIKKIGIFVVSLDDSNVLE